MSDPARPPLPDWARFWSLEFAAGGHPLTQLFSQRLGACIAFVAMRSGVSPSGITLAGAIIGLSTSLAYAIAPLGITSTAVIAIAYQLTYGFDCADGQLARASRRASEFGAWFDVAVDFVRYVAIGYAVLALLMTHHGIVLWDALAASLMFVLGTVVSLHTSISLQRQAADKGHQRAAPSGLRNLLRTAIDTPFLLLTLSLLRDYPRLLSAYVSAMGLGYLFVAVLLAARRLRTAPP